MFHLARLASLVVLTLASAVDVTASQGGGAQARASARAAAPIDLTGYWVALVTDDWRYRMLTPAPGNVDYVPMNAEGRRVAETWDPTQDEASGEACRAYGAAGVMRLPGRLRITWENADTLRIDTDAGTQTRRLLFGDRQAPGRPTWQGHSRARWELPVTGRGRGPAATGQLMVTTTGMRPGYLRPNGVPYSGEAVLTEHFVIVGVAGQQYLAVTTIVEDPRFLLQPYVKTYQFKKQPDAAGWNPTPCRAR